MEEQKAITISVHEYSILLKEMTRLDFIRMEKLHIEGLEGSAYTLIAYSKALKKKHLCLKQVK